MNAAPPVASVVVPAHDEERSIGRLLEGLTAPAEGRLLEVVVVCNGCSDATAERARSFPGVKVVEIPEPSKYLAMRRGSAESTAFPRVYVDADVEIDAASVMSLVEALRDGTWHGCGPARTYDLTGVTRWARWYYDVWQELPHVRQGLFGRGVVALSEEGHRRFEEMPAGMADDLLASELFSAEERGVVDAATVVVRPARTLPALVRRRIRVRTGNAQADDGQLLRARMRTRPQTLARLVLGRPELVLKMPVFAAVTLVASWRARLAVRRGDFGTWLRDESSRS